MMKDKTQNRSIYLSLSVLEGVRSPKGRRIPPHASHRGLLEIRRSGNRWTYRRCRLWTTKRGGKIWCVGVMVKSGSRPLHLLTSNNYHRHCVVNEITTKMQMLTLNEPNDA